MQPSDKKSFIANVNALARELKLLERIDDTLKGNVLAILREVANENFQPLYDDIAKGVTVEGKRKLDIETGLNTRREMRHVTYNAITIQGRNGELQHKYTMKRPTYKIHEIYHEIEKAIEYFNSKVKAHNDAQTAAGKNSFQSEIRHLDFDLTDDGKSQFPYLVSITDAKNDIDARTVLSKVILHVDERTLCDAREESPEFYWYKTTSAILSLHDALEIIMHAVRDAQDAADRAKDSAQEAADSAKDSKDQADRSEKEADRSREQADRAEKEAEKAKESEEKAKESENTAKEHADNAKESETNAKESEDNSQSIYEKILEIYNNILNALQGHTPVLDGFDKDFTLEKQHAGKWLQVSVPLVTDKVTITVPLASDEWVASSELFVEQIGEGTVLFVADSGVTLNVMQGTSPILHGGHAIGGLKITGEGTWILYGALEDI